MMIFGRDVQQADVAELAYAQVSEACGGDTLRVQVPPSAPDRTF